MQALFPEATSKKDKKRPTTAAFKIKTSINELVAKLGECSPHYIRCLKPNDNKRSGDFDDKRCLHQIQYLGLLENVRVRRAGFAYRHPYRPFYFRYRLLSDATVRASGHRRCARLLTHRRSTVARMARIGA